MNLKAALVEFDYKIDVEVYKRYGEECWAQAIYFTGDSKCRIN